MDKKIAILTLYYHNANYGALLQAYALQHAIENMGYAVDQISYELESGYGKRKHKIRISQLPAKLMNRYILRQMRLKRAQRDEKLRAFAVALPHTEIVTANSISSLNEKYRIFICGSDQIWNPIGWQPTLFLDFVQPKKIKIAYAASMARDELTADEAKFLRKYMRGFAAISVREANSISLIKNSGIKQSVELMPDPVFLLTEDQWKALAAKQKKSKPYLFAYFLGENTQDREASRVFAQRNGLEMRYIPYLNSKAYGWDIRHSAEAVNGVGIPEFLSLLMNAEAVITDSFHGGAFSILFRKRLILLNRFKSGDVNSMNSRLETLFTQTKMKLEKHQEIPELVDDIETPGPQTLAALQEMRINGWNFLQKYVEKAYET